MPKPVHLESASDVNLLEVGELRQQCRALGISTNGRRADLAARLIAVMGRTGAGKRSGSSHDGLRSHRTANSDIHKEENGRAIVHAMNRVKKQTDDAWNWGAPVSSHLNDPDNIIVPSKNRKGSRANTSMPGKRTNRGGKQTIASELRPQSSNASSRMDKSVLKQVRLPFMP